MLRQELVVAEREILDATDKIILPQSFLDAILRDHFNKDLPYPLTFQISAQGRKTHVGVREFSSEEGSVVLSTVVSDNLAVKPGMKLSISLASLEKGEAATFRPLAAAYDLSQDWKTALEGAFRSTYTTLTKGDVIKLRSGLRFLVDDLQPASAVCIVDTDLEVNLVPMSEEQAAASVRVSKEQATIESKMLKLDEVFEHDLAVDMILDEWDHARPLWIVLSASDPDAALLVGSDAKSTLASHIWSNLHSSQSKTIEILPSDAAVENQRKLMIAVDAPPSTHFSITITQTPIETPTDTPTEDETQCPNCMVIVPKRSFVLHERHCLRNNTRCKHQNCTYIFRKGIDSTHWHCELCGDPGEGSQSLHHARIHTIQHCECGDTFTNIPTLALHRSTTCSQKQIICQFCHLLVPQGDSTDLSYTDRAKNYTAHESTCGSRTSKCDSCGSLIKLKDFDAHNRLHDQTRRHHVTPSLCANQMCTHPPLASDGARNTLGLCGDCFGPLYSSQDDPDGTKLRGRVRRRYLTQLMVGCKRGHCLNTHYCATASSQPLTFSLASARLDNDNDGAADRSGAAATGAEWFCVGEATQRGRVLAEAVAAEGEYSLPWCCRAMHRSVNDVSSARAWLRREAVRIDEASE